MKKWIKIVGIVLIILILIVIGIRNLVFFGSITKFSDSCGAVFSNQFKEAIKSDDLNFCLNFDTENLKQVKNLYGNYGCRTEKLGLMDLKSNINKGQFQYDCFIAMMQATNNIEYCMQLEDLKEMCPYLLSRKTNNKDYCEYIPQSSSVYDLCIEGR